MITRGPFKLLSGNRKVQVLNEPESPAGYSAGTRYLRDADKHDCILRKNDQ